jgi:hypothetical protein
VNFDARFFTGIRQASAPAPGLRLELGPLGRCPRPLPRAPTLADGTILGLIPAFRDADMQAEQMLQRRPVTIQTEVDMRNLLFPEEQVPASTPIPPRGRDHWGLFLEVVRDGRSRLLAGLLIRLTQHRWRRGTLHASLSKVT